MDLILLWLLGVLAMFSSVGSVDYAESSAEPVPEPTAAASPAVDPIEDQFDHRSHLPACGQWDVVRGYFEESAQPGWKCLEEHEATTGAEAVFRTDAPGQGSTFTFVRVSDGLMEIYVNDSLDQVAPWTYEFCSTEVASFRQGCP